jgi:hypothetical protein
LTSIASHELVEAVTDPLPFSSPAFQYPDLGDIAWLTFTGAGGEIMDLCERNKGAFFQPAGLSFFVQRGWSNVAAAASHDPCQPEPAGEVYFNSVGVLPSTILSGGPSITTRAVTLSVGQSKTIEVDLYSDRPTAGPWTVQAQDSQALAGGLPVLSFAWDASSGQNGQKLHLTITANAMPQPLIGVPGFDGFVLTSTLGTQESIWVGGVLVE